MTDVVFADQNELFHAGMREIVEQTDDLCLIAQPRSAEQLLSILGALVPNVLVLSTKFAPAFPKIEPLLQRSRTALLLLAEDNDRIAYVRWLRAKGMLYRSTDGAALVDAMRRVARGESLVQNPGLRANYEPSDEPAERPIPFRAQG